MKRFLLIPSCALLALSVLTSCQKEEKTATQLANELTAELQNITDYRTAEVAAPRVEAMNKRFQNASVRVFSVGGNALAKSAPAGYAEALGALAKEIGRVRASKPVTTSEGEVDEARLIATVGVGAGVDPSAANKERTAKGTSYMHNGDSKDNNNPPTFAPCYGSTKLAAALDYTAEVADFPATRFDSPDDVPAIPAAVEPAAEEEAPAADAETTTEESTTDAATDTADSSAATDTTSADDTAATDSTDAADTTDTTDDTTTSTDDESSDSSSDTSADEDDDSSVDIDL